MRNGLTRRTPIVALAAALAFASSCIVAAEPQSSQIIIPQPIPPQFGFPVPAATINSWIESGDTRAIRGHAWSLWAGMASPSGQIFNGENLPIWETWYGTEDIFPAAPSTTGGELTAFVAARPRTALRAFVSPRQFLHNRRFKELTPPQGPTEQVVSFNKFDPAAANFITAVHPGPGGKNFVYNKQASLQALNSAWPSGASGQARGIEDFPIQAMELKPVFSFVKATGLTPQPLWLGPSASTRPQNPTPGTWTTCVLVDPAGLGETRPATAEEIAKAARVAGLACKNYLYGPLSLFYAFKLTAAEAEAYKNAQGGSPSAGDFAVLVAMHVNTKEIPFWTWQTFWWQPGRRYAQWLSRRQEESTCGPADAVAQLCDLRRLRSDHEAGRIDAADLLQSLLGDLALHSGGRDIELRELPWRREDSRQRQRRDLSRGLQRSDQILLGPAIFQQYVDARRLLLGGSRRQLRSRFPVSL